MSAREDCVRDMEGECVADPDVVDRLVEALRPLVDSNVAYLEKLEGQDLLGKGRPFHTNPEDRRPISLVNQITRLASRATGFSLERAQDLSVAVLTDVNMHTEAREVLQILRKRNPQSRTLMEWHLE